MAVNAILHAIHAIAAGMSTEEISEEYPTLTPEESGSPSPMVPSSPALPGTGFARR